MTRAKPDLWLGGGGMFIPRPSNTPPAAPADDDERGVTYVNGRATRNESTQGSGKQSLTIEDRQRIVERHFEVMENRQAENNLNFLKALELGKKLRKLAEG